MAAQDAARRPTTAFPTARRWPSSTATSRSSRSRANGSRDESLLDLVSRIKIHRNNDLTARYPRGIPNRIAVTLKDGTQFTAENEFPRGHDQNPMTDDEVAAKFKRMAKAASTAATQDRVLDLCWKLESLDDVGKLFALFPAVA